MRERISKNVGQKDSQPAYAVKYVCQDCICSHVAGRHFSFRKFILGVDDVMIYFKLKQC